MAKFNKVLEIKKPKMLGVSRLPAERIYLGSHLYKPSIVRLPDDKLLVVAEYCLPNENMHIGNDHPIFQSEDGGYTWSKLVVPDLTGGEPYLIVLKDGTLLMTGDHLIRSHGWNIENIMNADKFCKVHLSKDGGLTWSNPETAIASTGVSSRNVLELNDGSLMFISDDWESKSNRKDYDPNKVPKYYIWRSFDNGRTWSEKYMVEYIEQAPKIRWKSQLFYPIFGEAFLWQLSSGKVYCIARVSPHEFPIPDKPFPTLMKDTNYWTYRDNYQAGNPYSGTGVTLGGDGEYCDEFDRSILFCTSDLGRTWKKVCDLGNYGEMHYGSILKLKDGRLLLTFTVRSLSDQLGVQAVLGMETEDGIFFDLEHDRIIIESKSPMNSVSGGGFGPTVQLKDGTLVTSYSYRTGKDPSNDLHSEVVRWRLP